MFFERRAVLRFLFIGIPRFAFHPPTVADAETGFSVTAGGKAVVTAVGAGAFTALFFLVALMVFGEAAAGVAALDELAPMF